MGTLKRWMLVVVILISCVGCDQATKAIARTYLSVSPFHSYLGDIFRLQYSENPGAFLSLGSSLPPAVRFWIFTLLIGAFLAGMLLYLLRKDNLDWTAVTGYSLIVAGGLGNLIDRALFNGVVTDFLNIGIGGLRTGIFNIADVAIMVGAGMVIYQAFIARKQPDNPFDA
jgi:signal peptidase II